MTFKLYRISSPIKTYYDYSINDLAGTQDNQVLPKLIDDIVLADIIVLCDCINLTDMYETDDFYENYSISYPPLFIAIYKNIQELRSNLRSDLQQQFPEEFV